MTDAQRLASLTPPTQFFPLTRHLSYRLTPLLLQLPVTPNQVTALSLVCGLAAALCFLKGAWAWGVAGGLFLIACYTLDNCDGEIARIKRLSSAWGARFDDIVDWLVDAAFFAALGYGTSGVTGEIVWLWLGLAAAGGATIDYVIDLFMEAWAKNDPRARSREARASEPKRPSGVVEWCIYVFHKLSRADFCIIVFGLAAFDLTWVLLPLGAVGAQIYWITDLFSVARGYHV